MKCIKTFILLVSCAFVFDCSAFEKKKKFQIAVIPKGTTYTFWKSIHAGAKTAEQELGVEIIWRGPQKEDDSSEQISIVEELISRKVDAIVLAPADDNALVKPVEAAVASKINTVIIDSRLASDKYASFVATDNREGGRLAAKRMIELLKGKGKVIMMRYQVGSASTTNREEGFLEAIKKEAGITILSDDQFAGATRESAAAAAENLLSQYEDKVDGIFSPNESSTHGMLMALDQRNLAGK